jgi:hypothetical protein
MICVLNHRFFLILPWPPLFLKLVHVYIVFYFYVIGDEMYIIMQCNGRASWRLCSSACKLPCGVLICCMDSYGTIVIIAKTLILLHERVTWRWSWKNCCIAQTHERRPKFDSRLPTIATPFFFTDPLPVISPILIDWLCGFSGTFLSE